MTNNSQQAALEAASADSPFQIQTYPSAEAAAQAAKSKKRKRTPNATAPAPTHSPYHHQKAICALDGKFKSGQDLDMHYTVTPAQQWADAKRYKSFRRKSTSYPTPQSRSCLTDPEHSERHKLHERSVRLRRESGYRGNPAKNGCSRPDR
jgi:hypothetical protein